MSKPIIFSFFAGSGFLDLGFEESGFDVAFVNEFHPPFLLAYQYSRKKLSKPLPKYGYSKESIEELVYGEKKEELAGAVKEAKKLHCPLGFIGGPPCPDFSVAGKNKGKDGTNGRLTRVYIDAIAQHKPDFFVFENVRGLWRTKRHRAFYDEMKTLLRKSGYLLTDRLTNCIEYGAPQDRDRILLFGILKKKTKSKTDANLKLDFNWQSNMIFERDFVLDKSNWPETDEYAENSERIKGVDDTLTPLTVQHWFEKNDVRNHPNAKHHFTPRAGLAKFKVIMEGDDSKKSYKRLHRWRYSPTAAYGNNEVHLHPYLSRRISASEALAIQSLPKDFELPSDMSLSNMFKTIGNGVPFLAGLGFAKTINQYLHGHYKGVVRGKRKVLETVK